MKKFGENKAITLIALVITIIVMLILVGVTLSMISGENGILGKAEKAVSVTNESMIKEETEMAIAEKMMDYYADGASSGKTIFKYMAENLTGYVTPSRATISCGSDGLITYMDEKDNTVFLQMNENGNVEVIGTQNSGGEIRDSIKPIVKVDSTTTNSITFTATDGMGVIAYAVTENDSQPGESEWTDIEKSKKFTETVSGKATNKTYYIWAKDDVGNVSNPAKAVTSSIDVASSDNVSYEEVAWSGASATVTFTTTSKFTIQTSTNDTDWTNTNPITVPSGTQIYVRLSDGVNGGTSYEAVKPVLKYTIKYDGNGATSGSMESGTYEYGTAKNLMSNSFIKRTYNFLGWSTDKNATTATYQNEASVKNLTTTNGSEVTLYAVWQFSEWKNFLETAGIDSTKFTSLENFIANSTDAQKTSLCSNTTAMSYLRGKTNLISELKSTSNYGDIAKYMLSTTSSTNTANYNVGLPAYITKGNTLYLGGSWYHAVSTYGSYSVSNSSYIQMSITNNEGWDHHLRTTSKIDLSKYTNMVVYGYRTIGENGRANVGFATGAGYNGTGVSWAKTTSDVCVALTDTLSERKLNFGSNSLSCYFAISEATYGGTTETYVYNSYIY